MGQQGAFPLQDRVGIVSEADSTVSDAFVCERAALRPAFGLSCGSSPWENDDNVRSEGVSAHPLLAKTKEAYNLG